MQRIVWILVAGIVVLAVAWGVAGLPGHIAAQIGDWTVQTSTPVAVLIVVLAFLVLYLAIRFLAWLLRVPSDLGWWIRRRRRERGDRAVTSALVALAAGDRGDANREAARARRMLGDTPQTLLLAAEAGRLANREDQAEAAFRLLAERKDAAFLGYRGLLRQAIAREDWPEAAALARQAEAARPGAAWIRQERAHLAIRAGNWSEALALADQRPVQAALATAAAGVETDPARALRLARQAWKTDPALAPAAIAYAERLRADGSERKARSVLRHSWVLAPHPDLAACLLAPLTDPLARTKAAQDLTATNAEHPESRLLLATTALDAGLTGEARRQAESARTAGLNQRRLWLLLARIEEEERGDTEEGRLAQRDALRHAASADADPGWRCTACHAPHATWHPACPVCSTAGSIAWGLDGTRPTNTLPVVVQEPAA
jgi:HemY protein